MKNIELIKEVTHKQISKVKHDATYKRHVRDLEDGNVKQGEIDMSMKPTWKYCPIQKMDDQITINKLGYKLQKILSDMDFCNHFNDYTYYNDLYNELTQEYEFKIDRFERKYNTKYPR